MPNRVNVPSALYRECFFLQGRGLFVRIDEVLVMQVPEGVGAHARTITTYSAGTTLVLDG